MTMLLIPVTEPDGGLDGSALPLAAIRHPGAASTDPRGGGGATDVYLQLRVDTLV